MHKSGCWITAFIIIAILGSCSKKNYPSRTASPSVTYEYESTVIEKAPPVTKNAVVNRKPKTVMPKVITVNDAAAKKSVDGRLYYDVEGHRYWKNFKDGKYYLFNKSMYKDPTFKKPVE